MKNLLSLFLIFFSVKALAVGRLELSYGYFSINSKTQEKSATISSPTAANIGYQLPVSENLQFLIGYSLLLADISASDKGYGLNVGLNYFPVSSSKNEEFKSDVIHVVRHEIWKPFVGLGFYQREFQSIKNSYAGFGVNFGIERFLNKTMSLKGELRAIALAGANEAEATEFNSFLGVIFKI